MDHGSEPSSVNPSRPVTAIVLGGFLAGSIDLTYAILFYGLRGVPAIRIPQSIASGLLGVAAYQGGAATAALGVFLHFVIALAAAATFYLFSRKFRFLLYKPILWGPAFGAGVYLFMHVIVLPLCANPRLHSTPLGIPAVCDFAVHVVFLGPSIALAARRFII